MYSNENRMIIPTVCQQLRPMFGSFRLILFVSIIIVAGLAQAIEPLAINDLDGNQYVVVDSNAVATKSPKKATVLVFINTDCPIANSYHPALKRMADEFCGADDRSGFAIVLVHANPSLTIGEARKHQQEFDIQLPIVLDPDQRIAKAMKASITPEAIVVDPRGNALYRGRIDDRYAMIGKKRAVPEHEDLRLALLAIADGKPIEVSTTQAIGCRIKY